MYPGEQGISPAASLPQRVHEGFPGGLVAAFGGPAGALGRPLGDSENKSNFDLLI